MDPNVETSTYTRNIRERKIPFKELKQCIQIIKPETKKTLTEDDLRSLKKQIKIVILKIKIVYLVLSVLKMRLD